MNNKEYMLCAAIAGLNIVGGVSSIASNYNLSAVEKSSTLFGAAMEKNSETLGTLLQQPNVDIDARTPDDCSAEWLAVVHGRAQNLGLLLQYRQKHQKPLNPAEVEKIVSFCQSQINSGTVWDEERNVYRRIQSVIQNPKDASTLLNEDNKEVARSRIRYRIKIKQEEIEKIKKGIKKDIESGKVSEEIANDLSWREESLAQLQKELEAEQ